MSKSYTKANQSWA